MLWWVSVAPLGAPVVPEVNWMLIGSSNCRRRRELGQPRPLGGAAAGRRRRRRRARPAGRGADLDHQLAAPAAAPRRSLPGAAPASSGASCIEHAGVVAGLERGRGHQRPAADLVQRVFQLGQAIGRVDVDQDQAGPGGGELGEHPFGVVGRPDADAVARLEPERQQAGGEGVGPLGEFAPGPADALLARRSAPGRSPQRATVRIELRCRSSRRAAARVEVPLT